MLLDAYNEAPYVTVWLDTLFGQNIGNALNVAVVNLLAGQGNAAGHRRPRSTTPPRSPRSASSNVIHDARPRDRRRSRPWIAGAGGDVAARGIPAPPTADRKAVGWRMRAEIALLAGPALLVFVGFVILPVGLAAYYGFFSWAGYGVPTDFVGLRNYVTILTGPDVPSRRSGTTASSPCCRWSSRVRSPSCSRCC